VTAVRVEPPEWEVAHGMTYTMTRDDMFVEFFIDVGGVTYAIGESKLGFPVRVALDVPLCSGCDQPVIDGLCEDCRTIHVDLVDVEHLGPGAIAA
jgi:hypothetical protein